MSTLTTALAASFAATSDACDAQMRRLPTESLYSYLGAVRFCRHALDVARWSHMPSYFWENLPGAMENVLIVLTGYYRPSTSGSLGCPHCAVVGLIRDLDWHLHTYGRHGEDATFEPFLDAAREAIEDLDCPPWTH